MMLLVMFLMTALLRLTTEATATEVMVDTVWDTEVTERGQLMLTTVVAMEATAMEAMEAMARGQLMLRLTTVVAMEATAMEAMAATAAMARGLLMLTMVVPMVVHMAAMAAMDMATESNSSKEQVPHNLAPPNLIPDSQSVNPNLKLLYHDLNPLEI